MGNSATPAPGVEIVQAGGWKAKAGSSPCNHLPLSNQPGAWHTVGAQSRVSDYLNNCDALRLPILKNLGCHAYVSVDTQI